MLRTYRRAARGVRNAHVNAMLGSLQQFKHCLDVSEFVWSAQLQWSPRNRVCRDCQYPPCVVCGERRATAKTGVARTKAYKCETCKFPPCIGCGQHRPRWAGYTVEELAEWRCSGCTSRCSKCGAQMSTKEAEQCKTTVVCKRCRWPPCVKCGKPRPVGLAYHEMPL